MLRPYNPQKNSASFISEHKNNTAVEKMNELLKSIEYPNDSVFDLKAIDQTVINKETLEIGFK